MTKNLIEIRDLSVTFPSEAGIVRAVRNVSLDIRAGEVLGIVGESGSGKTVMSLSMIGLVAESATITGSITYNGVNLLDLNDNEMSKYRGKDIAMVFQDPLSALNPVHTIGRQIAEAIHIHSDVSKEAALARAVELLEIVGIPRPAERAQSYPHEFSGGMRQRVMIALAIANQPKVILADEPTTALDVTVQAQILDVLKTARDMTGAAVVLVTHDLGVVAGLADRVAIMYAGKVVELGNVDDVYEAPAMPYTIGLLRSIPRVDAVGSSRLTSIDGVPPSPVALPAGCGFAPRCPAAAPQCDEKIPDLVSLSATRMIACTRHSEIAGLQSSGKLFVEGPQHVALQSLGQSVALEVRGLKKTFPLMKGSVLRRRVGSVFAVDGVDLTLREGRSLALVGESGCGKTTLAKMLLGLLPPSSGQILIDGQPSTTIPRLEISKLVQPVFQDPYSSLNPRKSVGSIIGLPLRVQRAGDPATWRARTEEIMELVGLPRRLYNNYPSQLSGGQRQRVAIARALINRPPMVICDEPTSALDVSVQSQILNLLQDLRRELGLTLVIISHNLAVVEHMATRVAVMYLGRIVEEADTETLFSKPRHPYTKALLQSVLTPEPGLGVPDTHLGAAYPNPLDIPSGCSFHPRCAAKMAHCNRVVPRPIAAGDGMVECLLYDPEGGVAKEAAQ